MPTEVAALLSLTLSVLVGGLGKWLQDKLSPRPATGEDVTLEQRLELLGQTMRKSAKEAEELQAEIEARAARAEQLKEEARTAEEIARLNQAEREAVARLVRSEIGAESKRAGRKAYVANALFFVAGVLATLAITLFVHPLYDSHDATHPSVAHTPAPAITTTTTVSH